MHEYTRIIINCYLLLSVFTMVYASPQNDTIKITNQGTHKSSSSLKLSELRLSDKALRHRKEHKNEFLTKSVHKERTVQFLKAVNEYKKSRALIKKETRDSKKYHISYRGILKIVNNRKVDKILRQKAIVQLPISEKIFRNHLSNNLAKSYLSVAVSEIKLITWCSITISSASHMELNENTIETNKHLVNYYTYCPSKLEHFYRDSKSLLNKFIKINIMIKSKRIAVEKKMVQSMSKILENKWKQYTNARLQLIEKLKTRKPNIQFINLSTGGFWKKREGKIGVLEILDAN